MDIGLIFDLDGVITDTAEYHYQAWKSLADTIGIQIDRNFNEKLKGVSRGESLDKILKYGNKIDDFSKEEKKKLTDQKNEMYVKAISELSRDDILPGIKIFLDDAKNKNIKMVIASASRNAPKILESLEIINYFKGIVDPTTLKNNKPAPDIFEMAVEMLDLPASKCIGIEDSKAGIKGINAAGIFSVGIGDAEQLSEANYILESTSELKLTKLIKIFEENRV